jgi:murein DD-endopeptidase MepM/ murein hydrolase activator NlpD
MNAALVLILAAACIRMPESEGAPPVLNTPALEAVTASPENIPTPPPDTPVPTMALTIVPVPEKLVILPSERLSGTVFFDHNGDGQQAESEPGIPSVKLCIEAHNGKECTQSEEDGSFQFDNLDAGDHQLRVESPTNDEQSEYRYIMVPNGYAEVPAYYAFGERVPKQRLPGIKIAAMGTPVQVSVEGETFLNLALTQGYLTDPFSCQDRERITETHAYDLDPERGKVRDYTGNTSMEFTSSGRITDNHQAVDWGNSNRNVIGLPVRAAAPGIVAFVGEDYTTHGDCRMVTIAHPDTGHKTGYVHLEKILVNDNQEVQRGQILGTLGDSCTEWPHLHFTFNPGWDPDSDDWSNKNPYRDTQDPQSFTWWTVDNTPVCLELE